MTSWDRVLQLGSLGPFRASDAAAFDIPSICLHRWTEEGELVQIGRGLYRLARVSADVWGRLADVARKAPRAIFCLKTALEFHGLAHEADETIWLMVESKSRLPDIDFVDTCVVRGTGDAFHWGVEDDEIDGVVVQVTSPEKTVADCFRYRKYVGTDLAIDALRNYSKRPFKPRQKAASRKAMARAMQASRVVGPMSPYLDLFL
jgi:predicted transcriptional regulator of viral defense system